MHNKIDHFAVGARDLETAQEAIAQAAHGGSHWTIPRHRPAWDQLHSDNTDRDRDPRLVVLLAQCVLEVFTIAAKRRDKRPIDEGHE